MIIDFKTRQPVSETQLRAGRIWNDTHEITDGPRTEKPLAAEFMGNWQESITEQIRSIGRLLGKTDEIERRVRE